MGTPDRILCKPEALCAGTGAAGCLTAVRFGGSPYEVSERSLAPVRRGTAAVTRDQGVPAAPRQAAEQDIRANGAGR